MNPEANQPRKSQEQANALNVSSNTRDIADRFFSGIVEDVFHSQLGVVDTSVPDYISSVMLRTMKTEALTLRALNGSFIFDVISMEKEAKERIGEAKVNAYKKVGESIIFRAGLLPESLENEPVFKDLSQWTNLGIRVYHKLAELTLDKSGNLYQLNSVYTFISDRFPMVLYGMRMIREQLNLSQSNRDGHLLL
jgi:hypothetical protein